MNVTPVIVTLGFLFAVSCWLAGNALGFPSLISTAIMRSYLNSYVD